MFLGYLFGIKGYNLLDLETKKQFISTNVIFHENIFSYKDTKTVTSYVTLDPPQLSFTQPININLDYLNGQNFQLEVQTTKKYNHSFKNIDAEGETDSFPEFPQNITTISHFPGRSTRNRKAPSHLQDFICQQASSLPHSQKLNKDKIHTKLGNPFPLCATLSCHKLSSNHKVFVNFVSKHIEPNSYQQAQNYVEWKEAMKDKIDALELSDTWVVNVDGTIERYKARLVNSS